MSYTDATKRYASIIEAATYAGVSPRTIRRYIDNGRIKGYRMGPRLVKVDLTDIDRMPTVGGGAASEAVRELASQREREQQRDSEHDELVTRLLQGGSASVALERLVALRLGEQEIARVLEKLAARIADREIARRLSEIIESAARGDSA